MATYMDGMDGGKHNSDNTETSIPAKTFTVSIEFTGMTAKDPLAAAKKACRWILEDGGCVVYEVEDETTGKKFSVDLSEEDDDAVLDY